MKKFPLFSIFDCVIVFRPALVLNYVPSLNCLYRIAAIVTDKVFLDCHCEADRVSRSNLSNLRTDSQQAPQSKDEFLLPKPFLNRGLMKIPNT